MTSPRLAFVVACIVHAVVIAGGYMSLPPLFAPMTAAGWSAAGLQQAWAAIPLGSIFGALLAPHLIRSWGTQNTISAASTVAAIAVIARVVAVEPTSLALALLVYGAATGVLLAVLTTVVGLLAATDRAGLAQGIFFLARMLWERRFR